MFPHLVPGEWGGAYHSYATASTPGVGQVVGISFICHDFNTWAYGHGVGQVVPIKIIATFFVWGEAFLSLDRTLVMSGNVV